MTSGGEERCLKLIRAIYFIGTISKRYRQNKLSTALLQWSFDRDIAHGNSVLTAAFFIYFWWLGRAVK